MWVGGGGERKLSLLRKTVEYHTIPGNSQMGIMT